MVNLWPDLQEAFYITLGPFIVYLVLPLYVGVSMVLATLMVFAKWWRPMEEITTIWKHDE